MADQQSGLLGEALKRHPHEASVLSDDQHKGPLNAVADQPKRMDSGDQSATQAKKAEAS